MSQSRLRVVASAGEEELEYVYRRFSDGDEPALVLLLKNTFRSFLEDDFWVWKYKSNPAFDPSLVVIAEKNGEILGCNHWLVRDFKLSSSLKVRAALAAEIAVHPAHRGRGIGTELLRFLRLSGDLKEKGVAITYMFTDPRLNRRLMGPAAGYVAAPSSTTTYKKFFNCRELKEKLQEVNDLIKSRKELRTKLEGLKMSMLFRPEGAPVFTIHVKSEGIYLEDGEGENPDVVLEGTLPLSFLMVGEKKGVWGLARNWLTGKLRIRKGLLKGFRALKAFRVFQLALSENQR